MGARKENRDLAATRRYFDEQLRDRENKKSVRAALWKEIIESGVVLTFVCGRGMFTAGKYSTATGRNEFAMLWSNPSHKNRDIIGSSYYVSIMVTEFAGRYRPFQTSGFIDL